MTAPLAGVWTADFDTDGDLDLVVARRGGAGQGLRNNGDGSFALQAPFAAGSSAPLRGFAWADLDGDGVPQLAQKARPARGGVAVAVARARRRRRDEADSQLGLNS